MLTWYGDVMTRHPWESEADELFASAAGHVNAQHGRMVTATEWLLANTNEWQGDGVWTAEAYVTWRTGVTRATASKIVDIARHAEEFPRCIATMRRGELSLDQLAPIVRHAPGWCDTQMSGLAPRLTVAQISKVAREYTWDTITGVAGEDVGDGDGRDEHGTPGGTAVDSDHASAASTTHDATKSREEPPDTAWYAWDDHGRFRMHLDVGADSGILLETAITEAHDHLFHERTDTDSVTTLDAIIELADRSLGAIVSPARRSRYRANIHVDGATGETSDHRGRPISTGPARRISCDALVSIVHTDRGLPVSIGRSQHIVPDRTRRLVEHRDGGCRVPGCYSDRYVEVHHIIHWADGGPTDPENLLCLCPKHHRLHHQGRLGIAGNAFVPNDRPGALVFTDGHGIPIRRSGADPVPPGQPPPLIDGHYEHPLNERLDTRSLFFDDDPRRTPSSSARAPSNG